MTQSLRVAIAQVVQTPDLDRNLEKTIEFLQIAAKAGVRIVCFPETHLTGYRVGIVDPDAPIDPDALATAIREVCSTCAMLGIGAVVGTETPNPNGKPFNSALIIDEQGKLLATHHKSKLTPKDALGYAPGAGSTLFTFAGTSMGVVICFEGFRFPETTRALAMGGAKVVFHPQFNHVLPGMEWKLPVHEALLVARAAENSVYFVSANMCHELNNCRSMIISPNGLIQEASTLGEETLLIADLDPSLSTHAFVKEDAASMMAALAQA